MGGVAYSSVVVDKGGFRAYIGSTSLLLLWSFLRGGAGAGGPPPFSLNARLAASMCGLVIGRANASSPRPSPPDNGREGDGNDGFKSQFKVTR